MKAFELETGILNQKSVLRCLNYGDGIEPDPQIIEILDDVYLQVNNLDCMRGAYCIAPVDDIGSDYVSTAKGCIKSKQLAQIAGKSSEIAFCLVTAGSLLDQMVESSSDILLACIWDAVGTVMVENAVNDLLAKLRKEEGVESSLPFSPGYCDWELEGQRIIFSALDSDSIGIHLLSDSLMMAPQKSVAFVSCLGAGTAELNPCKFCSLKKCFMRR